MKVDGRFAHYVRESTVMQYLVWKLVHIVSVILFLGNITTGLFWAAHATQSRDFKLIGSTFDGISKSDRLFTLPGVIGIVLSGFAAAGGNYPILGTGWILWPIILFTVSGLIFGMFVAPLQRRISTLAHAADASAATWDSYKKLQLRWELWGLAALLTPAAAVVIMVLKPALPGLGSP